MAGLHVVIIGDILFSRVARSNIFGLLKLGARVTLVGPSTLVPREFEKLGVTVSHDIDEVLPTADVVNLLRIQHERQRKEYFPGIGEYIRLVWPDQRASEAAETRLPDHASGPDQPRRRNRQRTGRRRAKRHPGSSHQRPRDPHGGSLSLRRNCNAMNTIIRNGRIIDPANKRDEVADLLIVDGRIRRSLRTLKSRTPNSMRLMPAISSSALA